MLNKLEKLEIVKHADDLLIIRDLRNDIAHDYTEEKLERVFRNSLKLAPTIGDIAESKVFARGVLANLALLRV